MVVGQAPMCMFCKHRKKLKTKLACKAFPKRIPDAILEGFDHRKAYKGDNGIRFEQDQNKPKFDEY